MFGGSVAPRRQVAYPFKNFLREIYENALIRDDVPAELEKNGRRNVSTKAQENEIAPDRLSPSPYLRHCQRLRVEFGWALSTSFIPLFLPTVHYKNYRNDDEQTRCSIRKGYKKD